MDFFTCFEFDKETLKELSTYKQKHIHKQYTKMVYNFYAKFLPGVQLYANGRAKAADIVNLYNQLVEQKNTSTKEDLKPLKVLFRIESVIIFCAK